MGLLKFFPDYIVSEWLVVEILNVHCGFHKLSQPGSELSK